MKTLSMDFSGGKGDSSRALHLLQYLPSCSPFSLSGEGKWRGGREIVSDDVGGLDRYVDTTFENRVVVSPSLLSLHRVTFRHLCILKISGDAIRSLATANESLL